MVQYTRYERLLMQCSSPHGAGELKEFVNTKPYDSNRKTNNMKVPTAFCALWRDRRAAMRLIYGIGSS
jgi:hypothetical protein